jgi:hypothetical protein
VTLFSAPPQLTERQFSNILIEALHRFGYLVNHVYPLQTKTGFRTSTTLKGLPDLMAVGKGHTLWIEVKGPKTAIYADQLHVLDRFAELCPTNRCWLLRPSDDWQAIAQWIAYPEDAPRRFGWTPEMLERVMRNRAGKTTRR